MGKVKEFKHEEKNDVIESNASIEASVKVFGSMQNISEVIEDFELNYDEFCTVIYILDQYYRNLLKENDLDPDDSEEIEDVLLPSILEDDF